MACARDACPVRRDPSPFLLSARGPIYLSTALIRTLPLR